MAGFQVQRSDLTDEQYRNLADNVFPLLLRLKRVARERLNGSGVLVAGGRPSSPSGVF